MHVLYIQAQLDLMSLNKTREVGFHGLKDRACFFFFLDKVSEPLSVNES